MQNIHKKKRKVQRDLWRLSEVRPFGCHKPLSSRPRSGERDMSFSSIFSYNNK